jgi:hypothetical protein
VRSGSVEQCVCVDGGQNCDERERRQSREYRHHSLTHSLAALLLLLQQCKYIVYRDTQTEQKEQRRNNKSADG